MYDASRRLVRRRMRDEHRRWPAIMRGRSRGDLGRPRPQRVHHLVVEREGGLEREDEGVAEGSPPEGLIR